MYVEFSVLNNVASKVDPSASSIPARWVVAVSAACSVNVVGGADDVVEEDHQEDEVAAIVDHSNGTGVLEDDVASLLDNENGAAVDDVDDDVATVLTTLTLGL